MKIYLAIKYIFLKLLVLTGIIEKGEIPPGDYVENSYTWIEQARLKFPGKEPDYQEIHGAHIIRRILPVPVNTVIHEEFTQKTMLSFASPPAYVLSVPNGRVYTKDGVVITPDNLLLWDVSKNFFKSPGDHSVLQKKNSKGRFTERDIPLCWELRVLRHISTGCLMYCPAYTC